MGCCSAVSSISSSRKAHSCSWCDEPIAKGSSYRRYRWYSCGDVSTVKMHPECLGASHSLAAIEERVLEGSIEFKPGDE